MVVRTRLVPVVEVILPLLVHQQVVPVVVVVHHPVDLLAGILVLLLQVLPVVVVVDLLAGILVLLLQVLPVVVVVHHPVDLLVLVRKRRVGLVVSKVN